jgi:hypothetical protein
LSYLIRDTINHISGNSFVLNLCISIDEAAALFGPLRVIHLDALRHFDQTGQARFRIHRLTSTLAQWYRRMCAVANRMKAPLARIAFPAKALI